MTGYSAEEIRGSNTLEFFPGKNRRIIEEGVQEVFSRGQAWREAVLVAKDGREIPLFITGKLITSDGERHIVGMGIDITERKQAQKALLTSEQKYRTLFDTAPVGIAICSRNGRIMDINQVSLDTFGYAREEAFGLDLREVYVNPSDWERFRDLLERQGWVKNYGVKARNKDGTEMDCLLASSVLRDPDGSIVGYQNIVQDITERKRANELLLRTERIKAVGEMAGAVAHNFNNLLQIVMAGGQVGLKHLESGNTAQVRPEIEQILRTCDLGAETIKRLQEFAKVKNDTVRFDYTVFDLSHSLRQAVEMTKPWWKSNPEKDGITISLATDLTDGCFVSGKKNELFEVGVNLIKNATEACPKGGKINVRVFADEDRVVFQVQDDGVGIDEANLGKVFQPFWTTKGFQGTGMGLSSSYGIVTRHGGKISVESVEGRGTTFTVTLPKAWSQTEVPNQGISRISKVKLRILVVDDVDTLLKTIEDGLALYGQEVFTATSGKEALAIFNEKTVDVVVCDLGMEGMNGWEVSRAMKATCFQKGIPKTPFILLTGWGGQLSEQSAV